MRVVITEAALMDMVAIGRRIAPDNPWRATTFVDELYLRCQQLGRTPHAYPLLPGHEASRVRRRVHGNYLIFYRVAETSVEVLHVLQGARDSETILFPDD